MVVKEKYVRGDSQLNDINLGCSSTFDEKYVFSRLKIRIIPYFKFAVRLFFLKTSKSVQNREFHNLLRLSSS